MPTDLSSSRDRAIAVSIGEPAGVGAEVIAMAWLRRREAGLGPFYAIGDPAFLRARLARCGLDVSVAETDPDGAVTCFAKALPVVDAGSPMRDEPGSAGSHSAQGVIRAIEMAVEHVAAGQAAGLATAPIQKAALYDAGFRFPGHTEFLGVLAEKHWPGQVAEPVMMLAGPELRTVPVTVHIPIQDVPGQITAERLLAVARIVDRDLRERFGIGAPRLAVAGLNPHAGEGGSMGREDMEIIAPAIAALRQERIDARGPYPADTLFHPRARTTYDVVLAMYHDQALIPVKTIAFDETVNVTLGLPFVRTSPDHGTALDIAGKAIARPDSMIAALRMADEMTRLRDVSA
ncbi:4-hydroxythreonine-4-phosphate dehydrogenase [Hartmannibacter diazotrophicus]|uniref:4-hydroxythreonine-4-phosphate dehydrogenase n=1 Tax=Hartmannibacter diazotrophicus TaxID=1482074 RepID=A0A2C9D6Z6_9HYPH|nr:4-hydroxythreonine-4-phosphate dehydrogenase PdxA [Hartmannibacter diazotrophicus]SON55960.1 4-hydroxythreonine-4-phosphate dehydrogenase [Hartmannibacter diazotrophicus]